MFASITNDFSTTSIVVGIFVIIIARLLIQWKNNKRLPPGPVGFPVVGYLPFLKNKPYDKLLELKKKYGDIYSLRLGSSLSVVICDFPTLKTVYNQDNTMGRDPNSFFDFHQETKKLGAIHHTGWKEQRKYCLHMLRELGLGKSRIEILIREEIEELLDRFEKMKGEPIIPVKYLFSSTSNNISSLMFGKRKKFDDAKRVEWEELTDRTRSIVGKAAALSFFPTLKKLSAFLNIGPQPEVDKINEEMKQVYRQEIADHKRTFDPNNIRDFIDGYFQEIEKRKEDPRSPFQIPVLEDVIGLFFGAGSEALRVTMDWLVLAAAAYPEVHDRIQSEIDAVIGKERFPTRADYLHMPFTEAVILETYRWRAGLPINIPRFTLEDMKIHQYFIPKHTQIIGLFWAINRDPDLWGEDVDRFRPQRFLSKDEKQVVKPEYFIPFSSGRRACPGEALANVIVFLYFTAILQKFNLRFPEGEEPDLEGAIAVGLQTKEHRVCFQMRK